MAKIREYEYDLLDEETRCRTVVFDTVEEAEVLSGLVKEFSVFKDDELMSILDGGIGVFDNGGTREYSVFILSRK
jgi:hypothetical protein